MVDPATAVDAEAIDSGSDEAPADLSLVEEFATSLPYTTIIANVITPLMNEEEGVNYTAQEDGSHLWVFRVGSAPVFVHLSGVEKDDLLVVWSSVLALPSRDDAALFRELMGQNWLETEEAHYAVYDNSVVLTTVCLLEGLTTEAMSRAIVNVALLADREDDKLRERYGVAA